MKRDQPFPDVAPGCRSEEGVDPQGGTESSLAAYQLAHDLKTPLASILAAGTALASDAPRIDEREAADLVETIVANATRLERLVENTLALARAEGGCGDAEPVDVDLAEVLGAVLRTMHAVLAGRDVRVRVEGDPPEVVVDPIQIERTLANIVENAARFSPPGTPIWVSIEAGTDVVRVRIQDGGPGIPLPERERVFEPLYSHDRGNTRGGTGLGLAIARAAVEAHGGGIWIDEGEGCQVVFSLPRLKP